MLVLGMRRHLFSFLVLTLALLSAPYCLAQNGHKSVLPDRFGSWVSSTPPVKMSAAEQEAAILTEAGLDEWSARSYSNGSQTLNVSLKRFHDPSGAYEAYTAAINTEMEPSTVGPLTAIEHGRLVMLIGNFVVETNQPQLATTAELQELSGVVRKSADTTPLPPIRGYLAPGFTDGTQRYALGPAAFRSGLAELGHPEFATLANEVGFNWGAEAIVARYEKAKENGVLLLIDYPTPQLAEQHLRHLETALSSAAKQPGTTAERKGSLLSIVMSPSSSAFGESLRNAVRYQTEVTWNEPAHKLTDPPWLVIVGRIFIMTLLFMGLAVAVGAAFGGVRVLLKVLFPGKIFDRPDQMDVLQLGLSGKRIDSRDFY
jgi:uncharacterized protein DUF6599